LQFQNNALSSYLQDAYKNMKMMEYLQGTEHATTRIFEVLSFESERLHRLVDQIKRMGEQVRSDYERAESLVSNAFDTDDVTLATGAYWMAYAGEGELFTMEKAKIQLENQIKCHEFSVASLAGAVLQFAKQGISISIGELKYCSASRLIGTQALHTVIWQARNQALHWEAASFNPPVKKCFERLTDEVDRKFDEYTKRNMAVDVLDLFSWKKFSDFKTDMLSIS